MKKKIDAFLSHNSEDKPIVERIAEWLEDSVNISVWLDKWNLIPGDPWQEEIEKALDESQCCVVFLGPNGIGPWQNMEMRSALEERVSKQSIRVLPVLLPGATRPKKESKIPRFLRRLSWVIFRDNWDEEDGLHRLVSGIKGIPPGRDKNKTKTDICPFRGLEVFREQDQKFFFGREAVIQRLMDKLKTDRFILVLGPSGCGKSSVVQAGLIPHLREQALVTLFTPRERPIEELAIALRKFYPENERPPLEKLIDRLKKKGENLHYISREVLENTDKKNLVIVIDQFEELFTQTGSEEERMSFILAILDAVELLKGPVKIILTMRSDFIGKCAFYPDLNTYVSEHFFQMEPMKLEELRSAIEEPALLVGLDFETGLVNRILDDVKGTPGELPLLEHSLLELYEKRESNRITFQAYEKIGGIEGALVKRAESEFLALNDVQKEVLRKMFVLRLIQPGEGTEDTRRRVSKEELLTVTVGGKQGDAEYILTRWTFARLLTATRDKERQLDIVEVAHEALIRKWERIIEWMAEGREAARQISMLRQAAREWEKNEKNDDYLYQGMPLNRIESLLDTHGGDLTNIEKEFIRKGVECRNTEMREIEEQREKELRDAKELAASRSKAINRSRIIIAVVCIALISVLYFLHLSNQNEKKSRLQLAKTYWEIAQKAREKNQNLKAFHLFAEALESNPDDNFRETLLRDINQYLSSFSLLNILQQENYIIRAGYTRDDTQLFTWSDDGTLSLWDAATGLQIGLETKYKCSKIFFNNEGTRALTYSSDGTAQLRDSATGKKIGREMKHEKNILGLGIEGVEFNHNGTQILTWSYSDSVRLWDAASGRPIGREMNHKSVDGAIFIKNGTRIMTWGWDTIRLWNVNSENQLDNEFKYNNIINDVYSNRDGTLIIINICGVVQKLNPDNGQPFGEKMEHNFAINGTSFNRDETRILTWSVDNTARLWNVDTGRQILVMNHPYEVSGAVFSSDESRIITWCDDKNVRMWNANTGRPVGWELKHQDYVNGAVFNRDKTRILTWGKGKTAKVWNVNEGKQFVEIKQRLLHGAAPNFDGTRIITWNANGTVKVWDSEIGKPTNFEVQHKDMVEGAAFNHDETRILTWSRDGTTRLWDVLTGKPIGNEMKHLGLPQEIFLNSDGNRCVIWSIDNNIQVYDTLSGKPIGRRIGIRDRINGAVLNSDGTRVVIWSNEHVRLFDPINGKQINTKKNLYGRVVGAAYNKDKIFILSWNNEGTANIWDFATGNSTVTKRGLSSPPRKAALNINENRIITWNRSEFLRIWQTDTGKLIYKEIKCLSAVEGAVFNSNDTKIITWDRDGSLRIWDAATGTQIEPEMGTGVPIKNAFLNRNENRILVCHWNDASLWDADTGKLIEKNIIIPDANEIAISPNYSYMLTINSKEIQLFDTKNYKPIRPKTKFQDFPGKVDFSDDGSLFLIELFEDVQLWDTCSYKPIGTGLIDEDNLDGAVFTRDKTCVLTWNNFDNIKLWDIGIDKDFPMNKIKLQIQVLTGTKFNPNTTEISPIEPKRWRQLKKEYLRAAAAHYKSCKYPKANAFRKLFPEEAKKLRK